MTDTPALKPCPFCGGEAHVYTARDESYGYWGETKSCGCKKQCASSKAFDTEKFIYKQGMVKIDAITPAITAWNTRATDARIAELESAIKQQAYVSKDLGRLRLAEQDDLKARNSELGGALFEILYLGRDMPDPIEETTDIEWLRRQAVAMKEMARSALQKKGE